MPENKFYREFLAILDWLAVGYFVLDKDWNFTYWNTHLAKHLSKPKHEVIGKNLETIFPDIHNTELFHQLHKAMKEQRQLHFETFSRTYQCVFEVNTFPLSNGLNVFLKNITEQKRKQSELNRLSLVAKETDQMVMIGDMRGKILWINDAFTRLTGYSLEESIGKDPDELIHGPETSAAAINYIETQARKGEPFNIEVLHYTKNKEPLWTEVNGKPVCDEDGNYTRFFSIITDITKRKQLQQRLDEELRQRQQIITAAVIKAQEDERARVGLALHDNVNQVLTTVKLYQELCLTPNADTELFLKKSVSLLQSTINEIRSLSKQLSAPALGNIKLKDSVKDLVDAITGTSKISVHLDTTSIKSLKAQHELHLAVYRVLQEHLTNILKFTTATSVSICFDVSEKFLVLTINDNGKGFDTKKVSVGVTNMISRAESLNGTLSISSSKEMGGELIMRLPLAFELSESSNSL